MPITDLATNVILDNVGKVYFLKTGVYRDQVGLDNNHPLSSVSALLIHIEDGVPQNVMVANYAPSKMASWASHDFPLWYRGQVEYTITGESSPRTFAQYFTYVPSILVAMNKNGTSIMDVNVTITQSTGANLLGGFADLTALNAEFPPTEELSDDLATAYVYDSGTKGFYRVAWNSGTSEWVWQLVDQALVTYGVQTKQYNVLPIKVQRGYAPNQTPLTVSDEVIRLIYQEIAYVNAVIANHTELIQDLDDELVAHMADLNNPHEVTALQTAYSNIVSLLTATTVQGAIDEIVGRLDTAEEDIVALEGRMDTAEEDIDDLENRATALETFRDTTVPATYETIANADIIRGRTTDLENGKEDKSNKATDFSIKNDTLYPSTKAVGDYAVEKTSNPVKTVSINPSTYVVSVTYYNDTVETYDLPAEMAFVSASYDNETKDLTFVLQNGQEVTVPLDDIITGLATENWVTSNFYSKTQLNSGQLDDRYYTEDETDTLLDEKVDKVTGKSLVEDIEITKLTELDNQATLDGKINAKESVVNKGDMSVINTTKYPHTEGVRNYVRDIGLDTPLTDLNNHSLREVFEESSIYSVGKNLFDKASVQISEFNASYKYITPLIYGGVGNSITLSVNIPFDSTVGQRYAYLVDSNNNAIGSYLNFRTLGLKSFTRVMTTDYFRILIIKAVVNDATEFTALKDTLQLEQGTVATTYEPYKSSLNNDLPPFLYWFNLDTLGIDTLTVSQMDYWYSVYQAIKNETTTGGLLATLYDLFSSKANTTLETWIAPTLINSWAGSTARYYKNNFGEIRLSGSIITGTIGTTAFTLPTGYRPSQIVRCPVESNGAFGYVVINTDGTVVPTAGSNVRFSLDGVYFRGA